MLLAPAYSAQRAADAAARCRADGVAFNTQSRDEFVANWDRQVGCPDQYDQAVERRGLGGDARVRSGRRARGAPGVRRAPQTPTWGWNARGRSAKTQTPTLMVAGVHDKQVPPERVRELYADLGAPQKVFVDLACSSHNAMWEKNHLLLFQASLEWLTQGAVNGTKTGMLKMGYDKEQKNVD